MQEETCYIADCKRKTGWVRTSRSNSSSEEFAVTFKYGRTKRERYTRMSAAGMPGGPERTASRKMGAAASGGSSMALYSLEPLSRGGLVFGYAATGEEAILRGVKTLAAALEQL